MVEEKVVEISGLFFGASRGVGGTLGRIVWNTEHHAGMGFEHQTRDCSLG